MTMIKKLTLSALVALGLGTSGAMAAGGGEQHIENIDFSFDGPFGAYDVNQLQRGLQIYTEVCAACHGLSGEGNSAATIIVGGDIQSEDTPLRTVGSYWPYASTVFDFIRRAMPADAPKSLSDEEAYQVAAYVLYLNGLVGENEVLNAETLPQVRMPNADGFIDQSDIQ